MPAILLIPFRIIIGKTFTQDYLSYLLGALTNVLIFQIGILVTKNIKKAILGTFIFSFGTIFWYMTSVASAWYLGQVCAVFFITLALYFSLKQKNTFKIGIFLGASYLSRIHTILLFPFFIYLNYKNKKNLFFLFLGFIPFLIFNFYYNYIRFETIFDKSYYLIPNLFNEPWYQKGLFHYSYIPRHIKVALFAIPSKNLNYNGSALWVTSPIFLYILKAKISKKEAIILFTSIFLFLIPVATHGTNGFAQFGYRLILELYPIFMYLIFIYLSKNKISLIFIFLTLISFLINLWGIMIL